MEPEERLVVPSRLPSQPWFAHVVVVLNFLSFFALGVVYVFFGIGEVHVMFKLDEVYAQGLFDSWLPWLVPAYLFYASTFWVARVLYAVHRRRTGDLRWENLYRVKLTVFELCLFGFITLTVLVDLFVYGTGNSYSGLDALRTSCQC